MTSRGGTLLFLEHEASRTGASIAKRLKALEDENAKLKKLLAERCSTTPCSRTSQQKMVTPATRREAVAHLGAVSELLTGRCGSQTGGHAFVPHLHRRAIGRAWWGRTAL
jgi:hypothetical protein